MFSKKLFKDTIRQTKYFEFLFRALLIVIIITVIWEGTAGAAGNPDYKLGLKPDVQIANSVTSAPSLPTGSVQIVSGPSTSNGEVYYTVSVTCPNLSQAIRATVKYGDPTGGAAFQGTIIFASGAAGKAYWEDWGSGALQVLNELRAAGFRVVQYKWNYAWYSGRSSSEGILGVNCRAATLTQWVYTTIHQQDSNHAFCAYGHSLGASEVAYSMTQYGLANILSDVVLNSGPSFSRVDYACIQDDPAYQSLWWDLTDRETVDASFGQATNGTGPCGLKDLAWRDAFYQTSLASPDWALVYPNTMVTVIMGELDTTTTSAHGYYFYNKMVADGSPLTQLIVVPNADHNTFNTTEGANAIRDTLINNCHFQTGQPPASPTPTNTPTRTATAIAASTNTPTRTATNTPTATLTFTPVATATKTPAATNTATPTYTTTPTRTSTPTNTPVFATNTPTPTNTPVAATATATYTPVPTSSSSPRALGNISILSGPYTCSGETCYKLRVSCPEVAQNTAVYIKIGEPTGPSYQGTIMFDSGANGQSYWEDWDPNNSIILSDLRAAGYRTVQVNWNTTWFFSGQGNPGGLLKLSCRPATLTQWVHDHIFTTPTGSEAFCAYGHSNGAAQVTYSLVQYGLSSILDMALLNSGPNWSRVDQGCLQNDPNYQGLWFNQSDLRNIDSSYGFPANGSGACSQHDPSWQGQFLTDSGANGNWSYGMPHTLVAFLFGGLDTSITKDHGMYYYDNLAQSGTPLLTLDVVPDAYHNTFATTAGADEIRNLLINGCHVH